jgi:hypothetical protein
MLVVDLEFPHQADQQEDHSDLPETFEADEHSSDEDTFPDWTDIGGEG